MPVYDKPVWELMHEMVEGLGLKKGEVISKDQVLAWFTENYPKIKKGTISAHLIRQSTNAPSRIYYHNKPGDDDLFFQIDGSHFRLYDPEKDPPPIYDKPEQPEKQVPGTDASSAARTLKIIREYEVKDRQRRLQALEVYASALEQENERLRKQLAGPVSIADDICDQVLKERVSRLGSPPLDTLIREAGVVLEDRLRAVGGADSSAYGVALVDAVLDSKTGALVFSSHSGEQEGVKMLYRGAMLFIRNPPMHKVIEYPESTARLFIGLIDSLLQMLSELKPRRRGEPAVADIRRMLTRMPIPSGQRDLYIVLYSAGDQGLSGSELADAMGRSKAELSGVLGALGRRINGTEGLEGKGGVEVVLNITARDDGDWHYCMRPILRKALEAEITDKKR